MYAHHVRDSLCIMTTDILCVSYDRLTIFYANPPSALFFQNRIICFFDQKSPTKYETAWRVTFLGICFTDTYAQTHTKHPVKQAATKLNNIIIYIKNLIPTANINSYCTEPIFAWPFSMFSVTDLIIMVEG